MYQTSRLVPEDPHWVPASCAEIASSLKTFAQSIRLSVTQAQSACPVHIITTHQQIPSFRLRQISYCHMPFCPLTNFASYGMPSHLFTASECLHIPKPHIEARHPPIVFSSLQFVHFPPLNSCDKFILFELAFNYILDTTRTVKTDYMNHIKVSLIG